MHPTSTQRGSILVYAMLTMTVMLGIGLTLTNLFISKFRSAAAARNATVALYAADSAVEMCLYEARAVVDDPLLDMVNDAAFTVINNDGSDADITDDCSVLGGAFEFRATGLYRGSSRTLEISQ